MKRFSIILIAISILLAGCSTEPEETGILTISMGGNTRGMEVLDINTDHYMVEVQNTDKNISYGSVRVEKSGTHTMTVAEGNTTVTARAYDSEGTEVGNGQATVNVRPRQENNVRVTVEEIKGNGTLDITITSAISNVELVAEIYKSIDQPPYRTVKLAGTEGVLKGSTSLENGFYTIRIKDADGNIYGPLKPFRIVAGKSVGYSSVIEDRFNISINIQNDIIPTPSITITGGKAEYRDGDSYSLKAEVQHIENPTFQWFLDGNIKENYTAETLSGTVVPGSLKPGKHIVSVLAGNGPVIWTESIEFTYIPSVKGITVDPVEISVGSEAAEKTFTVTRNTSDSTYEITALPSWITIRNTVSEGLEDRVTLSIAANDGTAERHAVVNVGNKTLTVVQSGKTTPAVPEKTEIASISTSSLTIEDSEGGSAEFTVARKNGKAYDYTVNAADSWLSIEKVGTSGLVDTWRVTTERNAGDAFRKTNVQVGSFSITVLQLSAFTDVDKPQEIVIDSIYPALNGGNIAYKDMNYQITAHVLPSTAPQTLKYKVVSMGTRNKSYGTNDWRITDRDMEAFLEYDQNGRFSSSFDFWLPGTDNANWSKNFKMVITTEDGTLTKEIPFTMDRDTTARIESVNPASIACDKPAGETSFIQVTTSTEGSTLVSIVNAPEWVYITEKSINGKTREFSVEFTPHRGTRDRNGEIVFADQNGNQKTVSISQKADPDTSSSYVWLSGANVSDSDIDHLPDGKNIEVYEKAGVYNGWYNVSKSHGTNQAEVEKEDSNLCWAMSASAAIHWWADHNKAYIDAFTSMHPEMLEDRPLGGGMVNPKLDIRYSNEVEYIKDKSTVAKVFVRNHFDEGDDPRQAVEDMLFTPRAPRDVKHRANAYYPGWFEEVFKGRVNEVLWDTPILDIHGFNKFMNDTIENNTCLIMTYDVYRKPGSAHAVNIWGIKYDEYGNIDELMIADNNFVGTHKNAAESYMYNVKVKENAQGYVELVNMLGKAYGRISILTSLDLGTEIWNEWATENNVTI